MVENFEIVPALITDNQEELNSMIEKVKDNVNRVQLDFMDGNFVPNKSLDFDFELNEDLFYEAHLMVDNPTGWIEKHGEKVDLIIPHFETVDDVNGVIDAIKDKGKKVGIALNPSTMVNEVFDYADKLDLVLVMTVEPGAYGSEFLPNMLNKVKELRKFNEEIDIEVDGGIVPGTALLAKKSGANIFVSGSYIMKSNDPKKSIKELKNDVK